MARASTGQYQHPDWWTPELEKQAVKLAKKKWIRRCDVCGVTMRVGATRCGEFGDGHQQRPQGK